MQFCAIHAIGVATHGRYLLRSGAASAAPLLVGFHGYAESADQQMRRLEMIPGVDAWTLTSIQGLHRFYRRHSDEVVASWMTRQDRELMIEDNIAYVDAVVDAACAAMPIGWPLVFAGFSQGVAMAFRAGGRGRRTPAAVVAFGGDVPPELEPATLRQVARVLVGRGRDDRLYTETMMAHDIERLTSAGVAVESVTLEGGHEWSPAFADAVGRFLAVVRS